MSPRYNQFKSRTNTIKNIIIIGILIFVASFTSCKKLIDNIEPKSFVDKFYDQTLDIEWTVDSIRYTKYDESKHLVYDDIKSVGKMVFEKPISESNNAVLGYGQGYFIHTYSQGGQTKIDKNAYRLKNSGTEIKYLELYYKPLSATNYTGVNAIIYDIQLLDKDTYHLYRYEHLQDVVTGQWQGYLRSVIKMHR